MFFRQDEHNGVHLALVYKCPSIDFLVKFRDENFVRTRVTALEDSLFAFFELPDIGCARFASMMCMCAGARARACSVCLCVRFGVHIHMCTDGWMDGWMNE